MTTVFFFHYQKKAHLKAIIQVIIYSYFYSLWYYFKGVHFVLNCFKYSKLQMILFTKQNNCFIYINVSFKVAAFYSAINITLLICVSSYSV